LTQLQQNRYDQLLRRVGDLKGPGSKVNDSLSELFPMFDVENVPAELLVLSGSRLCMGSRVEAAGGATFHASVMLRNPGGSGAIVRVAFIEFITTGGTIVNIGPTQNTFGSSGVEAFADGRIFGQGTVAKVLGENNNLVTGSTFFRSRDAGTGKQMEPPLGLAVLSPGNALSVSCDTDNLGITVSFIWVERLAQPSELNL